jgi:uncharacterized protein (DUF2132 family)
VHYAHDKYAYNVGLHFYLPETSMTDSSDINYQNNPLHGVGLKQMLEELVSQYGFQILFAYLNINCFKTNPTVMASVKFLKKTDWAREKVEVFYLYQYKNLPNPSSEQFKLSPRDRVIPAHHQPDEPKELSLEDADKLREKREQKSASHRPRTAPPLGRRPAAPKKPVSNSSRSPASKPSSSKSSSSAPSSTSTSTDPWAKAKSRKS